MLQVVVQVDRCKVVAGAGTSRGTPYQPIQHPPGSTWGSALVVHAAVITQMKAPKHGCCCMRPCRGTGRRQCRRTLCGWGSRCCGRWASQPGEPCMQLARVNRKPAWKPQDRCTDQSRSAWLTARMLFHTAKVISLEQACAQGASAAATTAFPAPSALASPLQQPGQPPCTPVHTPSTP
jgi:hypothetical protein